MYWQDITEPQQTAYLDSANEGADLDWHKTRRFVATALGDASAYQFIGTGGTYERIHERIRAGMHDFYVTELGSVDVPLVVLAHSLGGHMMSNYIWDMQPKDDGTARAGWSVDLSPFERAGHSPGSSRSDATSRCSRSPTTNRHHSRSPVQRYRRKIGIGRHGSTSKDKDDILGWPLQPLSPAFADTVTDDIQIDVGNPLTSWNPASHVKYWTDNSFTKPVATLLSWFL